MTKCHSCKEEIYFGDKVTSFGMDWHRACLKCAKCGKILTPGLHSMGDGKPYCTVPCYAALFGPGGIGHGGTENQK